MPYFLQIHEHNVEIPISRLLTGSLIWSMPLHPKHRQTALKLSTHYKFRCLLETGNPFPPQLSIDCFSHSRFRYHVGEQQNRRGAPIPVSWPTRVACIWGHGGRIPCYWARCEWTCVTICTSQVYTGRTSRSYPGIVLRRHWRSVSIFSSIFVWCTTAHKRLLRQKVWLGCSLQFTRSREHVWHLSDRTRTLSLFSLCSRRMTVINKWFIIR